MLDTMGPLPVMKPRRHLQNLDSASVIPPCYHLTRAPPKGKLSGRRRTPHTSIVSDGSYTGWMASYT